MIEIINWMKENKLKTSEARLLLEAYRRYHMFHKNKTISEAWIGLGKKEYDNSSFFSPVHKRPDKYLGWYRLNKTGTIMVSRLNALLPWKKEYNLPIFEGRII